MIQNYPLFVTLAIAATFSPGPAVVLAMSNSFRYGTQKALMGILGNITALFVLGIISISGMGLLITTSPKLYALLGVLGGMYLIYMGFKMITGGKRAIVIKDNVFSDQVNKSQLFKEAFWVAMSNPKALVFLMALFPQFVDENNAILPQFYF